MPGWEGGAQKSSATPGGVARPVEAGDEATRKVTAFRSSLSHPPLQMPTGHRQGLSSFKESLRAGKWWGRREDLVP